MFPSGKTLRRIYQNLGIEDRLSNLIPAELPKTPHELFDLLEHLRGVVPDAQLLPILEVIERDHRAEFEKYPGRSALMADIYKSVGQTNKALEYLNLAASKEPRHYLSLYLLSLEAKPEVPAAERETYLAKFLDAARLPQNDTARPAGHRYTLGEAYSTAISALRTAGRYQECLALIGQYERDESFQPGYVGSPSIVLDKARCLDTLGDVQGAVGAYEAFLAASEDLSVDWYAPSRERAKERIRKLTGK